MTTDTAASFDGDLMQLVGYDMTAAAARQVYEAAGVDPRDIRVVELHDCFTTNEVHQLRGAGAHRRRARRRSSSPTATTPTAAGW